MFYEIEFYSPSLSTVAVFRQGPTYMKLYEHIYKCIYIHFYIHNIHICRGVFKGIPNKSIVHPPTPQVRAST